MSLTVTLAARTTGHTVEAGIEFVDGVAEVAALSPNQEKYFALAGARVTEGEADNLEVDGRRLADLKLPELREIAAQQGIDLPSNATKRTALATFATALKED